MLRLGLGLAQQILVGNEGFLRLLGGRQIIPSMDCLKYGKGVFPAIAETTHGSKNKQGRIQWALQGRLEQGRLTFKEGAYLSKFKEQAMDFPNPMAHDDMLDALAYIDQVATVNYMGDDAVMNDFEFMDDVAGY